MSRIIIRSRQTATTRLTMSHEFKIDVKLMDGVRLSPTTCRYRKQ